MKKNNMFFFSPGKQRKNTILLTKQKVISLKGIHVFLRENKGQGSCAMRKE